MRKGAANTQRGTGRFVEELVARLRRAGATGELIMRFDSGFWSIATIATLKRLEVGYTMGIRMVKSVVKAVDGIEESAWTPIDYTPEGEAEVAECDYKGRRLIVRRTRLVGRQATLWPQWRHFAFLTDLDGKAVDIDAFHRAHATVELAIRDLKEGAGLEHVPSGQFFANAAWLVCAALAHDLVRWTAMLGDITPQDQLTVARTVRTKFLSVPGRLVSRSGRPILRSAARVAMGRGLRTRPEPPARSSPRPRVAPSLAAGAPQDDPTKALTTEANDTKAWSCPSRLLLNNCSAPSIDGRTAGHVIPPPVRSPIGGSRLRATFCSLVSPASWHPGSKITRAGSARSARSLTSRDHPDLGARPGPSEPVIPREKKADPPGIVIRGDYGSGRRRTCGPSSRDAGDPRVNGGRSGTPITRGFGPSTCGP